MTKLLQFFTILLLAACGDNIVDEPDGAVVVGPPGPQGPPGDPATDTSYPTFLYDVIDSTAENRSIWTAGLGKDYQVRGATYTSYWDHSVLEGVFQRASKPQRAWYARVTMPHGPEVAGKPNENCVTHEGDWVFYSEISGYMIGLGDYEGTSLHITTYQSPPQRGTAANVFDCGYGYSSWFQWTVVTRGGKFPKHAYAGKGDFNVLLMRKPPAGAS